MSQLEQKINKSNKEKKSLPQFKRRRKQSGKLYKYLYLHAISERDNESDLTSEENPLEIPQEMPILNSIPETSVPFATQDGRKKKKRGKKGEKKRVNSSDLDQFAEETTIDIDEPLFMCYGIEERKDLAESWDNFD